MCFKNPPNHCNIPNKPTAIPVPRYNTIVGTTRYWCGECESDIFLVMKDFLKGVMKESQFLLSSPHSNIYTVSSRPIDIKSPDLGKN